MGFSFFPLPLSLSLCLVVCVVPLSFVPISFGLSHQSMCPRQPHMEQYCYDKAALATAATTEAFKCNINICQNSWKCPNKGILSAWKLCCFPRINFMVAQIFFGDCRLQTNMIQINIERIASEKRPLLSLSPSAACVRVRTVYTQIKIREWWAHVNNCCLCPIILFIYVHILRIMHIHGLTSVALETDSLSLCRSCFLCGFLSHRSTVTFNVTKCIFDGGVLFWVRRPANIRSCQIDPIDCQKKETPSENRFFF